MKPLKYLFTILSIFAATHICSAQKPKESVSICNLPEKKILPQDIKTPADSLSLKISPADIRQFTESGCDSIVYKNVNGEVLKINNFMFSFTKVDGNGYFEKTNGARLTKTMKERLLKAVPGDRIMISVEVKDLNKNTHTYMPKALVLYKVVE